MASNAWAEEPEYEGRGNLADVERLYSTLILLRELRRGRVPFADYEWATITSAKVDEYLPEGRWTGRLIGRSPSASRIVACPTCGANDGKGCKTPTGKPAEPHAARRELVLKVASERDMLVAVLEVSADVVDGGRPVVVFESEVTLMAADGTLWDSVGGLDALVAEYRGRLAGASP